MRTNHFSHFGALSFQFVPNNQITLLHSHQFDGIDGKFPFLAICGPLFFGIGLTVLDFSGNNITGLPNHVFSAESEQRSLLYIDFSNNSLYNVGPHFLPMASMLSEIRFHHNFISKLSPKSFSRYTFAMEMDFSFNKFMHITSDPWPKALNLKEFSMRGNPLKTIGYGAFQKFSALGLLDLSHTKIFKLEKHAFYGLYGLSTLRIEYSKLKHLSDEQFSHLVTLRDLHLANNQIDTFWAYALCMRKRESIVQVFCPSLTFIAKERAN